ncbi:MAG: endopeptidase La [Sandaracinaceae bacterium]|nr:endopeptidase La [Sandaracinaceae bacterium]
MVERILTLPLLPLRRGVVLPGRRTTLPVGRPRSRALAESLRAGDLLVLGRQLHPTVEEPLLADLNPLAVVARTIGKSSQDPRGFVLEVEPLSRAYLLEITTLDPFWQARIREIEEPPPTLESQELAHVAKSMARELFPQEVAMLEAIATTREAGLLADRIAAFLELEEEKREEVLKTIDPVARLRLVISLMIEFRERNEIRRKLEAEVREEMKRHQRENLLRQQLRAIQKELGEEDPFREKVRKAIDGGALPEEVKEAVERELRRLDQMGPAHAESAIIRNYLEWVIELPWNQRAESKIDLNAIEAKLEEDHYGLKEPKRRILEHMAVLKLEGDGKGAILCFVGPPGVGKTSLANSIASAIGRPLVRIALGGVRDEAEIRGHRRTYIGALPGRFIHALRKAKVKNPVIVLDEIDKVGKDWRGDPTAALLEVLDPEQNRNFIDHYLELPFDLSEVLFIATANDVSGLIPPLRDRLDVVEIDGYTIEEKVAIAERHLLPQAIRKVGLSAHEVEFPASVIEWIAREYTREAGVRQLSRSITRVLRSFALEAARKDAPQQKAKFLVTEAVVKESLGQPKYSSEHMEQRLAPGIAAGLAWTPSGGEVLYIESTKMPGKGKVEITGQLGEVMKESAQAALAYLRAHAQALGINPQVFETHDLHIHVPAGAVPKDGPSAGITILTALASLLTERSSRADLAMTGEITLRGRVLRIGGLKAKLLAAQRAGFRTVLIPSQNLPDLAEIPPACTSSLEIVPINHVTEAIELALGISTGSEAPTPSSSQGISESGVISA